MNVLRSHRVWRSTASLRNNHNIWHTQPHTRISTLNTHGNQQQKSLFVPWFGKYVFFLNCQWISALFVQTKQNAHAWVRESPYVSPSSHRLFGVLLPVVKKIDRLWIFVSVFRLQINRISNNWMGNPILKSVCCSDSEIRLLLEFNLLYFNLFIDL